MYVFAHIIPLGNRIKDIISHILRVRRGETDTHAREFLCDYLKQLGKSGDVFILVDEAIRIDILTQQDNLLASLVSETVDLIQNTVDGSASLASTSIRDNTVRTEIVAASHDRDISRNTIVSESCRDDVAVGLSS